MFKVFKFLQTAKCDKTFIDRVTLQVFVPSPGTCLCILMQVWHYYSITVVVKTTREKKRQLIVNSIFAN